MALYNVMLKKARYPLELEHIVQEVETAMLPGRWEAILSQYVNDRISYKRLFLHVEDGTWQNPLNPQKAIPVVWRVARQGNIYLSRRYNFEDLEAARIFISNVMLYDWEFYVIGSSIGEPGELKPGEAWYGVISNGRVEFDDQGDISHLFSRGD
jgi:hypothetical protein